MRKQGGAIKTHAIEISSNNWSFENKIKEHTGRPTFEREPLFREQKIQIANKVIAYIKPYRCEQYRIMYSGALTEKSPINHCDKCTKYYLMLIVVGTLSCHLMMTNEQVLIPGISVVVKDGIYEGLYAYEAGQVAVGDIFSLFMKQ